MQVSVRPFIQSLGYDTSNLAEVLPEFHADPSSKGAERVDYVIQRDGKPVMIIEVKAAGKELSHHHWKQLHNYFAALDVDFGVLTNGIEYRFYTDSSKLNIMDEDPFFTVDMLKLDSSIVEHLRGFSKPYFAPEQTLRKLKISSLLEKELQEPSDKFVEHFAREVHAGRMRQSVIADFRPIVKRAWDDLVDQEIARRLRRHEAEEAQLEDTQPEPAPAPAAAPTPEAPVRARADIPETGAYREIPVTGTYKGISFEATLLLNEANPRRSKVRYAGAEHATSSAAILAIRTINPEARRPNGWTFWKYQDPDTGEARNISDLRD